MPAEKTIWKVFQLPVQPSNFRYVTSVPNKMDSHLTGFANVYCSELFDVSIDNLLIAILN